MSIFKRFRDYILINAESKGRYNLKFPLQKTGNVLNNYTRGDFIVVGGRKTSGKSSFILNNYVISPIVQKLSANKNGTPFDLKVIYLNTRKSPSVTIDRMIVNYTAHVNGGSKIGVPTMYGYQGSHVKITRSLAKTLISRAIDVFDKFSTKNYLSTIPGRKSMFEIDNIIRNTMEEFGEFDEDTNTFTYDEKHKDLIGIVAIDDVTSIYTERGVNNLKNENAHELAIKLKSLAKLYNIIIVLAVPSAPTYIKASGHRSSLDEIAPYGIYADRALIMHNPLETNENQMVGYQTADFINTSTGVNYLRTIFVASNYMGPSGIYFGCFLYPENGYMMELPPSDDEDTISFFTKRVNE